MRCAYSRVTNQPFELAVANALHVIDALVGRGILAATYRAVAPERPVADFQPHLQHHQSLQLALCMVL